MIHVDETDPIGEVELSFPYRDVQFRRGVDPKDSYDMETEIGRGKFGTVYRCRDRQTGLALAAKFIAVPKKEDRRNVEREVEIMRELQHPRLIQLYDAFENNKVMCVVLELIEGGELFERVIDDDFILTEKSCTVFMRQICEGIGFIHKQRILHLDMKPENILCLTKTGNRIKIIDFGLARRFDPDKKLQVLFGTPEFVAPEVVNFDQIGYGTDMWSVGVICYVLLSGLSPFMGHTDVETMANVTIAKYDFDDEAFDEISDAAKDFIKKLVVKDMNKRLTADECLKHPWLRRKELLARLPSSQTVSNTSMDVAKDNLKLFVERWNEHPNSPYVFDTMDNFIQRNSSMQSLSGNSPSPCGSLASSIDSDAGGPFMEMHEHLVPSSLDHHIRRASDSSFMVKAADISERVNLAEEIRKLSDKLFQLSTMPTILSSSDLSSNNNESSVLQQQQHDQQLSMLDEGIRIPWRRPKFRLSQASRDVPRLQTSSSFREQFQAKLSAFNRRTTTMMSAQPSPDVTQNTPDGTKNLLLTLLDCWDGPQQTTDTRHNHPLHQHQRPKSNSISTEWNEHDLLGQRTISSLNTFFQSRATTKKITPFHKSESIQNLK